MRQSDMAINDILFKIRRMCHSGSDLCILCSGGVDSMALLLCASKLMKSYKVSCLHFTHDIRPEEETDKDFKIVEKYCKKFSIPLFHKKIYPNAYVKEHGGNLEDIARSMRIREAHEWRVNNFPVDFHNYFLTAHHADDQLETILMKIGRGCGLRGLTGIQATFKINGDTFVRPMLHVTKDDCKKICFNNDVEWHEDITNDDTDLLRNKLRKDIIPLLKEILPRIATNAQDLSEICSSAQNVISKSSANLIMHQTVMTSSRMSIRIEALRLSEDIIIYEWILGATGSVGGDSSLVNKEMMDKVIRAIREKESIKFNWVRGLSLKYPTILQMNDNELVVRHGNDPESK